MNTRPTCPTELRLLTIPEAAAALRLSPQTIRRRIADGLPVVRTGGPRSAIRIDRDELDRYLAAQSGPKETPADLLRRVLKPAALKSYTRSEYERLLK